MYLYGVGTSSLAAQDCYYKLLRVGIHANFYADVHMQAISTALITSEDVVIGFSHSGSTRDVVDVLSLAKERGAFVVCITNRSRSPISKVSDVTLRTASEETPFGSGGMPSMMSQLSVVDALFVGVSLAMYEKAIEYIELTGETVKNKKADWSRGHVHRGRSLKPDPPAIPGAAGGLPGPDGAVHRGA